MPYSIRWNGPKVEGKVRGEVARRMEAATVLVANRAKVLISEPYPPPSAPGEPPHRRTGRLRASVTREVAREGSGPVGRVGTNVKYGRWLELGTSRMAARPWLRRALAEMRPAIMRLFGG